MFRLRPTARQHIALAACVESHRELYNAALQERRDAWAHSKTRIRYGDQSAQLTDIRSVRPDVAVWSFSSQQATLRRLAKSFGGFFRRVKAGQTPGYPRFKGAARFDSVVTGRWNHGGVSGGGDRWALGNPPEMTHSFLLRGMLIAMTRWYPLEPANAEFFASAPHIFRYQKRFAASPEQVWESLTSDASVAAWGRWIKEVIWTSPRPFGVGTTREAAVFGTRARERYFRWDEGHGHSFAVSELTTPLYKRFAEDYVIEPDDGGTLFNWTVAIEPKAAFALPFKALAPVLRAVIGRIPSDGQRHFARRA